MHTQEPWEINIGEYLGRRRLESKNEHGIVNDGWIIGEFEGPDAEDNAKRIKDCVNALAGVPDPAKLIEAVDNVLKMSKGQALPHHVWAVIDALRAARGPKGVGK